MEGSQEPEKINFESKTQLTTKPKNIWDYFALDEKYKH